MPTEREKQRMRTLARMGMGPEKIAQRIRDSREWEQKALAQVRGDGIIFGERGFIDQTLGAAGTAITQPFKNVGRDISYYRSIPPKERTTAELIATIGKMPLSAVAGIGSGVGEFAGGVIETVGDVIDLTGVDISGKTQRMMENLAQTEAGQKALESMQRLDEETYGVSGDILDTLNLVGATTVGKGATAQSLKTSFKSGLGKVAQGTTRVAQATRETARQAPGLRSVFSSKDPQKLATEILQPSKASVFQEIRRGEVPAQVEALIENVEVSKNFGELKDNLKEAIKLSQGKIDDIIKSDNFAIDSSVLGKLDDTIEKAKVDPSIKESVVKTYNSVKERYEKFFDNVGQITREDAQKMKQALNKTTEPLQKKKSAGTITGRESAELQALDHVRDGLKEAVEGGDEVVKNLNAKYRGLKEAVDSIAAREVLASKAIEPTLAQRVVFPVLEFFSTGTGVGSASFIARQALKAEESLEKLTKELKKISGEKGEKITSGLSTKTETSKTMQLKDMPQKSKGRKSEPKSVKLTDTYIDNTINQLKRNETLGQLIKKVGRGSYKTFKDFTTKDGMKKLREALKEKGISEKVFWTTYIGTQNNQNNNENI